MSRKIRKMFQVIVGIGLVVILLVAACWAGLQVKASPFPEMQAGTQPTLQPIPDDLPGPVQRYAQALFPDGIPEAQTAIVQGRARLAPNGLAMPTRFRFYYDVARSSYYHDIRVTWFDLKVMEIHERLLDGHSILDLSIIGRIEDEPHTNTAAMQGYWAEVLVFAPALALTDARLHWETINETTVRLQLPELGEEQSFLIHFDPDTGLLSELEAQRYRGEDDDGPRQWRNRVLEWGNLDGWTVPLRSETQWDDDTPWATWELEQVVLKADVSERMATFGGDS